MTRYILQRAIAMILTLFAISTITFFLMHAIPGGPFTREKPLEPAIIAALNEKYHLDDPLFKQYTDYMGDLLHGDFGPSFKFRGRTVNELIGAGFPDHSQDRYPCCSGHGDLQCPDGDHLCT